MFLVAKDLMLAVLLVTPNKLNQQVLPPFFVSTVPTVTTVPVPHACCWQPAYR